MILQKSSKKSVMWLGLHRKKIKQNWEHDVILNWMMKLLLFHALFWDEIHEIETGPI